MQKTHRPNLDQGTAKSIGGVLKLQEEISDRNLSAGRRFKLYMILTHWKLVTPDKVDSLAPAGKAHDAICPSFVTWIGEVWNLQSQRANDYAIEPQIERLIELQPVDQHFEPDPGHFTRDGY
jgi:hypothetical protein